MNNHIGERNTQAKLTSNQVLSIVKMKKDGISYKNIANKYSISQSTVCDIIKGRSWAHVTNIPPKRNIERMKVKRYLK